ncbi:hypothetical protein BDZ90DRAFT_225158 [Jaminaea rosea]|uniref:Endonuclease/exonuclease/phosphatase domain-containing protein n=1 Tax=Jaminaea rosea TaxID=1569628 RepID=A0A316V254_9BASI|nr:hypothetical protein BDZ90DRAFT_225158 [Jaminaea rosea]PWN30263.1 hypothetical protein BDZ90DRAFT_225158 [Jaminaea rosea]
MPSSLLPTVPNFTTYLSITQWVDSLMKQYRSRLACPKCRQRGVLYKNWGKSQPSRKTLTAKRHRRYDHQHCLDMRNFSMSCADFVKYVLEPYIRATSSTATTTLQRDTAATLLKGCELAIEALAEHGNEVNKKFHARIGQAQRNHVQAMAALQAGLLVPDVDLEQIALQETADDAAGGDIELFIDGQDTDLPSPDTVVDDNNAMQLLASLEPPTESTIFSITIPAFEPPPPPQRARPHSQPRGKKATPASLRPQKRKAYVEDDEPEPRRRRKRATSSKKSVKSCSSSSKRIAYKPQSQTQRRYLRNMHGRPGLPKPIRGKVIIRASRGPPPPVEPLPVLSTDEQLKQLRAALMRSPLRQEEHESLTISYLNVNSLNAEKWHVIFSAFRTAATSAITAQVSSLSHIMILAETWRPRSLMMNSLLTTDHAGWILASAVPTPYKEDADPGAIPRCNGGMMLLCPPQVASRVVVLSITPYSLTFSLARNSTSTSASTSVTPPPIVIHAVYLPPSMGKSIDSAHLLDAFVNPPDHLRADVLLGDTNVYYEPQAPILTGERDPDRVEEEEAIVVKGYPKARLAVIEESTRRLGLVRLEGEGEEEYMRWRRKNRKGLRLRRTAAGEEPYVGKRPTGVGALAAEEEESDSHEDVESASAAIPALSRIDHTYVRPPAAKDQDCSSAKSALFSASSVSFWRPGIKTDHPLMRVDLACRP